MSEAQPVPMSDARLVARHIDAIGVILHARVIAVTCVDQSKQLFTLAQPGMEVQVMQTMGSIDWNDAVYLAEAERDRVPE